MPVIPMYDAPDAAPTLPDRRAQAGIAAALFLLPLLYFLPAVLGRVLLAPGDGWTQIFGIRLLIGQMIARGEMPLWNPYIFAGMPLLASIQPGALYPPTWFFAVFAPGVAMNVMMITTYHLALIGTYLYARRVGASRLGALVAGLCFTFGGYLIAHLGHPNRVAAAVWLPWILLAIEHLYWRATWRWVALGALFIALQLFAGEPQMNCYTVAVAGAYGLAATFLRAQQQPRRRLLSALAAMAVCGLLLSAVQLMPERELLRQTARAQIDFGYFIDGSLPPWQALGLVFPYFFGGAASAPYRVAYWGGSNSTEASGYIGMLGLLLAIVALVGARRRLLWFWSSVAALSLVLALRGYLPFGLAHALYHIPVYNLFRSAGRHLFECDFALAMLAGLGVSAMERMGHAARGRVLRRAGLAFIALVAATALVYRFSGQALAANVPRPVGAQWLTNPEAFVPLLFAVLSLAALWYYARRASLLAGALLIGVLFLDLCSFGHFYEWPTVPYSRTQQLADPPAVAFIKAREPDLNAFRVLTHPARLDGPAYATSNAPNLSLARGLQSVNGYDPLRVVRATAIAGALSIEGAITDPAALDVAYQGFDLLNVKYLLRPTSPAAAPSRPTPEGIEAAATEMNLHLVPGQRQAVEISPTTATELTLVTSLASGASVADDAIVAAITLHTTDGQAINLELRAGRDTAESAYERADVRAAVQHQRAQIADSWQARDEYANYEGHHYLARLPFARATITRIEFDYRAPQAELNILRAALYDATTQLSTPLAPVGLPPERWRKLAQFEGVDLYENLRALPRAWFVRQLVSVRDRDVLDAVRTERLPDGSRFDPAQTALFTAEDVNKRRLVLPEVSRSADARVQVTRYTAQRIELATHNAAPGFLVLSEIYLRGWEAWLDGARLPIERVNFILRGVAVPPGDHRIEFVYRVHSFRNGLLYSLLGVALLLAGAAARRAPLSVWQRRWLGHWPATAVHALRRHWPVLLGAAALVIYAAVLIHYAAAGVGGADSSGYGRSAQSLLRGRVAEPAVELARYGLPDTFTHLFIPIGSTQGPRPGTVVSFYPVGLPLHLALAALLGGWRMGPFWVSPLAATFSLLLIYLVGRELGLSRAFAAAGAAMLGATPTVLFIGQQAVSDVVAMSWALVAVWAALRVRRAGNNERWWAMLAGAAFGLGFLVRPLNILVLLPVLLALPYPAPQGRRWTPRVLLWFVAGGLPVAAIFCAYNYAAFNHPLQTGYGAIQLHSWITTVGVRARFQNYVSWLVLLLGPLTLIGWAGLLVDWRMAWRDRFIPLLWFGGFLLFYSCYDFQSNWPDTRFLLPGIPALILGALLVARDAAELFRRWLSERARGGLRWALGLALTITALTYAVGQDWRGNLLAVGAGELVYADSCRAADHTLPPGGLIVAGEMTGALKFYTARSIVRWDEITPEQWPTLRANAERVGQGFYALLAAHEIPLAQPKVPGRWRRLGDLRGVSLWEITFPDLPPRLPPSLSTDSNTQGEKKF